MSNDVAARRLMAHLATTDTRWFKVHAALLDFGLRGVPEDQEPRSTVKRLVVRFALWMDDVQVKRTNKRFDRSL